MSASQPAEPPDPRSPRQTPANALPTPGTAPSPAATPQQPPPRPAVVLPPGALGFATAPPPQQRPNLGSLLFMSAMFFLMSGNNNGGAGGMNGSPVTFDPEGNMVPRVTALDKAQMVMDEYKGYLNGSGNWTEPATPGVLPQTLVPARYRHDPAHHHHAFYSNITGFHRDAAAHIISLVGSTAATNHSSADHSVSARAQPPRPAFFKDVHLPDLSGSSAWNETRASELRGDWPWAQVAKWEMNLKERLPEASANLSTREEWHWVRGSASIQASDGQAIEYGLYGLHYLPNGTYELFGMPDGKDIDIRNIPRLFGAHGVRSEHERNTTRAIVLAELEKDLNKQKGMLLQPDARVDDVTATSCPLLLHLSVPPIPAGETLASVAAWRDELAHPTGIRANMHRPPGYWQGVGLGGVAIADECGFAFGIDGGRGLELDDFWRKSVNYAAFATAVQVLVLLVLVRQIDSTRTPSTLAKISLWSIVLMGIADSWLFSAHVVVGIMSDNRASVPMLIPGFLCLCTAIFFGPRYAVMLYRVQAPERSTSPPPPPGPAPRPVDAAEATSDGTAATPATNTAVPVEPAEPQIPFSRRVVAAFASNPIVRWFAILAMLALSVMSSVLPGVLELLLFTLYSFWVPQIWRNARRGSSGALQWSFILGTTAGRLALPLYAFACPDNVFFIERANWVWFLVAWQLAQVAVLFAQELFGASFFLPKRLQPAESYNYHPVLQAADAESGPLLSGPAETTCSICMEEVDIRPHSLGSGNASAGEAILGLGTRKAYALAPCHHLFHTKCLAQWLAIKTICPLCKRSLPPL